MKDRDERTVADVLSEALPVVDEQLAARQVIINARPLQAAILFCRECVLKVSLDGRVWTPDLKNSDFLAEKWFRGIYHLTEQWYEHRYGQAFEAKTRRHATSFVVAYGLPLQVNVPLSIISPGEKPQTSWLSFPDALLPTEDPLAWLSAPPNLSEMEHEEKSRLRTNLNQVSNSLRSISSYKMGITGPSEVSAGFISSTKNHLDAAVHQVLNNWQGQGTANAAWELHMACELALKAVAETKTGQYKQTHDLLSLFEDAAPHLADISRDDIGKLPHWRRSIDHRYGQGTPPSLREIFEYYCIVLSVVDRCFRQLATLYLGKGSFLIATPPWKKEIAGAGGEDQGDRM